MIKTNTSSIRSGNLPAIRKQSGTTDAPQTETLDREALMPPARRGFLAIPTDDVLQNLINRAVSALKAGILWDRGSILNIQA